MLAGQPVTKSVPGLGSFRIAIRDNDKKDEFDIPGTGDAFHGDWADLVNNFYMTALQENYHMGKRNVRVSTTNGRGSAHHGVYRLSQEGDPDDGGSHRNQNHRAEGRHLWLPSDLSQRRWP